MAKPSGLAAWAPTSEMSVAADFHDGKKLLFSQHTPSGGVGTYALALDGSGKIQPFLQSNSVQTQAQFSPDGQWVAYASSESGRRDEVYVQPFPGPGGKWMISSGGCSTSEKIGAGPF